MLSLFRTQMILLTVLLSIVLLLATAWMTVHVDAQGNPPSATPHHLYLPLISNRNSGDTDPTRTGTPTTDATSLPTATGTSVGTPSSTGATATNTATATATATFVATSTPTPSPPATATPTGTATATGTSTATVTATSTATAMPTVTTTATPTPAEPAATATSTPSNTPTRLDTATATDTPTSTNPATPTHTATPTDTPTPTNTPPSGTGPQPCNQLARDLILTLADLPDSWTLVEEGAETLGEEVVALGAVDNYTARYINYLQLLSDTSAIANVVIVFQSEAGASGYLALLAEVAALDPAYSPITVMTIGDETLAYESTTNQQGFDFTNHHIYVRKRNVAFVLTTVALATVASVDDAQAWAMIGADKICNLRE